jgi:hypothetical protein
MPGSNLNLMTRTHTHEHNEALSVADCRAKQGICDWAGAEAAHVKALKLKVLSLGALHPSVAYTISEIACMYEATRSKDRAYEMRAACVTIWRECAGPTSEGFYRALHAQAVCCWKFGDYQRGEVLGDVTVL